MWKIQQPMPGQKGREHLEKYGHPSKFGFKDVINEWKADKWDPEGLR
jgi:alpha-L-fucosidase